MYGCASQSVVMMTHRHKHTHSQHLSLSVLSPLQLKPTLSKLHADLKLFEHHFEWLNRVSKKHQHPSLPKLAEIIKEMKTMITFLCRQVIVDP